MPKAPVKVPENVGTVLRHIPSSFVAGNCSIPFQELASRNDTTIGIGEDYGTDDVQPHRDNTEYSQRDAVVCLGEDEVK